MSSRRDVLIVSLGATAGLREADSELTASLRRAGATVVTKRAPTVRTFALTDLLWAHAARRAAAGGPDARAVLYSSVTAALLWPRPDAVRFDAPAASRSAPTSWRYRPSRAYSQSLRCSSCSASGCGAAISRSIALSAGSAKSSISQTLQY